MSTPLMNWSENFTFEAAEVQQPVGVEALQEIISASPRAKAVGTRHCFNRIADSPDGVLIDTSQLELAVTVDHDAMTATVPAGWSYSRLVDALEAEGVALPNLASLPHISIAGATATGTHGSGDGNQVLSAVISGIELVDGEGELRTIGRDHPDLKALSVGLGAFGVFTRLTLDVEPSFQVQSAYYHDTSWQMILENLDEVFASAYSVNLHAKYGATDVMGIWSKYRLDGTESIELDNEAWGMTRNPGQLEAGKHTLLNTPGPWSMRLAHFLPEGAPSAEGDELQSEYYVDRRHGVDAINALRALGSEIDPHLRATEIRTVASDDIWLSPCYQRETLSLGFTWQKHVDDVPALLPRIEEALAPFEARPHWGKLYSHDRAALLELWEHFDDALTLAESYDPNGTFHNPYLDRLRG